jgi:hypothetical protein
MMHRTTEVIKYNINIKQRNISELGTSPTQVHSTIAKVASLEKNILLKKYRERNFPYVFMA